MINFKLDSSGDIVIDGQNNIALISGDDELMQQVNEVLRDNVGEWFLNPLHGFERSEVQGKNFDNNRVIDAIYNAMLQIEEVNRIENINLDFDRKNRKITIVYNFTKSDNQAVNGTFEGVV